MDLKKWMIVFFCHMTSLAALSGAEDWYDAFTRPYCENPDVKECMPLEFILKMGYKTFFYFPTYSYGFVDTGPTFEPLGLFSAHDQPKGAFGQAGGALIIDQEFLPELLTLLNTALKIELLGSMFGLNDKKNHFFINLVSSPFDLILPDVDGNTVDSISILAGDILSGFLNRSFYDYSVELLCRGCYEVPFFDCLFMEPIISLAFERFYQNYCHQVQRGGSFTETFRQSIRTNFFDIGGGLGLGTMLFGCWKLSAEGKIYGSYVSSCLRSFSAAAGVLFPDMPFAKQMREDEVWGTVFRGQIALEFLKRHCCTGIEANYEYYGTFPKFKNPQVTPSLAVLNGSEIKNVSAANYSVLGKIVFFY